MAVAADGVLPSVTIEEAIARVTTGARIIDVREQSEWDDLHAPQAELLPMSAIGDRLDELSSEEQVLIICHSGGRSARVTASLIHAGYDAVNVEGGMLAWRAAGGVVVAGASGEQRD